MEVYKTLKKLNDSFTINMYDNGYMVEASGTDANDNWVTTKYVCKMEDELINHVRALLMMERT